MYDVVVKKFMFAISSPDEFLSNSATVYTAKLYVILLRFHPLMKSVNNDINTSYFFWLSLSPVFTPSVTKL